MPKSYKQAFNLRGVETGSVIWEEEDQYREATAECERGYAEFTARWAKGFGNNVEIQAGDNVLQVRKEDLNKLIQILENASDDLNGR